MRHRTLPTLICRAAIVAALAGSAYAQAIPIVSLAFEGNRAVDATMLKAQLRITREGGWYNASHLQAELQGLEAFLQDQGFLRAKVGPPRIEKRAVPGKGEAAVIRIPIVEGTRYVLGELQIQNVQVVRPSSLLQMSPIRPGQPYSRGRLAEWRAKIDEMYHSMGYIRAETTLKEEVRDARGIVDCILECKEGSAYRIGKIDVTGDASLNRSEFKRLILLGEGSTYNPEMLILSVQFLNTLRTYRPISESDVEVKIDDATHTVNITFKVTPLQKPATSTGGRSSS